MAAGRDKPCSIMIMPTDHRNLFQLDSTIHFLNHGSFGACPIPVFEAYQAWQRRLERQPVLFLGREFHELMQNARSALASYFNTQPEELAFVPNATHGVNIVARSLALRPGDEILGTDHEYGACSNAWDFVCQKTGAAYIRQPIALPVNTEAELVDQIWRGVTLRTRLIFLSHITSPTALRLPVETICARAREAGILTLVDGAHAPGQIPLDFQAIGADYYTGNCHKWMMAPKGAGFLYARSEMQGLIEPLVVSWGYSTTPEMSSGVRFIDLLEWTGTCDPAAYLAVPAALEFFAAEQWETVRERCYNLLRGTLHRIYDLTGMVPAYPDTGGFYRQMAIAPLPEQANLFTLKRQLYDDFRVEVPLIDWNGRKFVRISVQGYNTTEDLDALVEGLGKLLG